MEPLPPSMAPSLTPPDSAARHAHLREAALQLEATFLAEMLKSAGLTGEREALGGGAGEAQFGSFLVQAQAEQMARAGGIGLAESLFKALLKVDNHDQPHR